MFKESRKKLNYEIKIKDGIEYVINENRPSIPVEALKINLKKSFVINGMDTMNVNECYDKVALNYNEKFSKGILGSLRRKERKVVFEFLDLKTNELILEAGCGSGFDARPLLEMGCDVYGVDISEGMVKMAWNS